MTSNNQIKEVHLFECLNGMSCPKTGGAGGPIVVQHQQPQDKPCQEFCHDEQVLPWYVPLQIAVG